MNYTWLNKKENPKLLIFFNGWGMDQRPFQHLSIENSDLLMIFDYKDLYVAPEITDCLRWYPDHDVIAWSMGVWAYSQVANLFSPRRALAINGTLQPIHDQYGIPVSIFDRTLNGFSDAGREKFLLRMFKTRSDRQAFADPERDLDDQRLELLALRDLITQNPVMDNPFSDIVVCDSDKIIPTQNQLAFWQTIGEPRQFEGGHFPFMKWNSWNEIIDDEG